MGMGTSHVPGVLGIQWSCGALGQGLLVPQLIWEHTVSLVSSAGGASGRQGVLVSFRSLSLLCVWLGGFWSAYCSGT